VHGMRTISCDLWSGGTYRYCPPVGRCVYTIEMATRNGRTAFCGGDSGGPIYYWTGGVVIAAGLVSWGAVNPITGCGTRGGASVVATAVSLINGLRVLTI
jgi:secreted trypsin-like serine protease